MRTRATALLCSVLVLQCVNAEDSWPEWRGATGQGVSNAKNLPIKWSETKNVAWKQKVPGLGWSTPVVANGIVWVTSAVDTPATKKEAKERRQTTTNSQPLKISSRVSFRAIGIDLKSGKKIHDVEVLNEKNPQIIHRLNSYASPSPIIEDGRLYCHFGPSGIACLDIASNKVLWTNRSLKVKHENGPGSSPILWQNLLIIHCDGIDQQYIIALDKNTGKQAWKRPRSGKLRENPQLKKSYATSLVTELNGTLQVVSPSADWIYG